MRTQKIYLFNRTTIAIKDSSCCDVSCSYLKINMGDGFYKPPVIKCNKFKKRLTWIYEANMPVRCRTCRKIFGEDRFKEDLKKYL